MTVQAISSDHEKLQLMRLRDGDEKAFDYFYNIYSLPIYRKLLKMIKVEFVAEEILQTVFIKVWDKRGLIDPQKGLKAYLYQIAQNLVYDFYRNMAREEKLQAEVKYTLNELSAGAEENLIFKETNELLELAIEQLPDQQRLVFRLCKQEGKSYGEVSELLGISTSTINGHIVKATKNVKLFMFKTHNMSYTLLLPAVIHFVGKNI